MLEFRLLTLLTHIHGNNKLDRNQLIIDRTLRNLKQNLQMHIRTADKGKQTVILNKDDDNNKVMKILEAFQYRKLNKNPPTNYEEVIKTTIRQLPKKRNCHMKRFLCANSSTCPRIYGSPYKFLFNCTPPYHKS